MKQEMRYVTSNYMYEIREIFRIFDIKIEDILAANV